MTVLRLPEWRVLVTAVHPREREAVGAQLAAAGAEYLSAFSTKDPPHLVITSLVRSPKYRALMRAHPHTPVVTPEWLAASTQAGTQLPYDAYRVGPFHGLTVCFSGMSGPRKAALAAHVQRGGGVHQPALDKRCTHLVTNATNSEKYRFARREKIPVVTMRWVEDSLAAGWCQDEAPYILVDDGQEGTAQSGLTSAVVTAAVAPQAQAQARQQHTLMDEATNLADPAPGAGGALAALAGVAPTALPPAAAAPADADAAQRAAHQAALDAQLEWDDGTPPFLDAVRLRLVGCSAGEGLEALGLVRQGAAKRFADWVDDLNHVVVGSDLTAAEAAEALDFLSTHRSCVPVTLEWLRQSVAAQKRLRPDGFLVPTSRLAQYRRRPPALEHAEAAGRVADRSMSSGGVSEGGAAGAAGAAGELTRMQSVAAVSGPLDGCYFTLAALRGTDDEATARRLVQENGGRVFTDTTVQRVTDKAKAYALCPHSLVTGQATQLRHSCPDFRLVDERNRFTLYWLECSIKAGAPLAPNRGAPLYQPLPFPLPMASMRDVVVCISGYDVEVRAAITRAVLALGATVTPESMTRRNTHLILPAATGLKYEHSAAFGVIPVTADWLVDTVLIGRRQPEENYVPLPPPGQPAAPASLAARAGARETARGAGYGGPTQQIMTTQMGPTQAARVAERPRGQIVLPPPPTQQQQQPALGAAAAGVAAQGGRRMSLREKMRASQAAHAAAASVAAAHAAPAQQQQQPLPTQRLGNDENEGSNSQPGAADFLQLGSKPAPAVPAPPPAALQQQQAQQAQQPPPQQQSTLDQVMADLDTGLREQQAAAVTQQQQQQQQGQQQRPASGQAQAAQGAQGSGSDPHSLFDALFGPDPTGSDAGNAAPAEAAQASAAAAPPGPSASEQQGGERGSGRTQRASNRRRSGAQQQQQQAEQRAESGACGPVQGGHDGGATAGSQPAAAPGAGSEPQEDVARALDKLSDRLLGGLPAEALPGCGSQLDALMPPPPARTRAAGAKRGAATPAESAMSNGSGGSRGGRAAKRPTLGGDDGAGSGNAAPRPLRRSGRGRVEPEVAAPHLEMSQQVGYADAFAPEMVPLARPPRGGGSAAAAADKQLVKQELLEAAGGVRASTRRAKVAAQAAARAADPLADLLV